MCGKDNKSDGPSTACAVKLFLSDSLKLWEAVYASQGFERHVWTTMMFFWNLE